MRSSILSRLLTNKVNYLIIGILLLLVLSALIGPLTLKDSSEVDLFNAFKPPLSSNFVLGTDQLGRDVFSGVLNGLRVALFIGVLSSIVSLLIGSFFGVLSGYLGDNRIKVSRLTALFIVPILFLAYFYSFVADIFEILEFTGALKVILEILFFLVLVSLSLLGIQKIPAKRSVAIPFDSLISRLIEVFNSVPRLMLVLTFTLLIDQASILHVVLIIGLSGWTNIARIVRGEIIKYKSQDFIESARASGISDLRIVLLHLVPNILPPVLITLAFSISGSILFESTLSFLGLGMPTEVVTLGSMLMEGRSNLDAWWLIVIPGLILFILVTSLNLLGTALTKAMETK